MTRTFALAFTGIALLLATGCRDAADGPIPAGVLAQREMVTRQACISRELLTRAEDDIETLEDTYLSADPDDPLAEVIRQASASGLEFMHAYFRHAELRATALAYIDSAVNHSATPADSIRYTNRSDAFTITVPREGTLEANAMLSYQQAFEELLLEPDHPCNWDF
jgi:hypothetical protein